MGGSALGSGGERPRTWRTSEAGHHRAADWANGCRLGHLAGLLVARHVVGPGGGEEEEPERLREYAMHLFCVQVSSGDYRSLRAVYLCVSRLEQVVRQCTPGGAVASPVACSLFWALLRGHMHLLAASASTLSAAACYLAALWWTTMPHDAWGSPVATRSIRDCWNSVQGKLFPSCVPAQRLL